jgi:indole-3-glycerol phosphate synthase
VETTSQRGNILERIVETRRGSIAHRKRVLPDVALKLAVQKAEPPRDLLAALSCDGYNIIAELKKASPSRGLLRDSYVPGALASNLENAGAAALSVLTEEDFFCGSLADLREVKKVTRIPVLRKDFIVDPWQVWESRAGGADSFLLIVAVLNDEALTEMLELGRSLKMEALVEVHTREELERAINARARCIGVNNRDLRTFETSIETSLGLVNAIPDDCIAVSESGLRTHSDLANLRQAGFDAFLIGEQLMRDADPSVPLRDLLGGEGGRLSVA